MRFLGDKRVQSATGCGVETIIDIGDDPTFGHVHRLGRHALDDADAGDDDFAGTEFLKEPVQQNAPVGQAYSFRLQPRAKRCTHRLAEIDEAETRLDGEQLVVPCGRAPREAGDHLGIDPDLLGDMIEHNSGKQFAATKVAPRITQTAELQRVAEPRLWCAGAVDGSEVVRIQTVMANTIASVSGSANWASR